MIERRSIILTSVVLAMLFAGAFLFLLTSGGPRQARIATNEAQNSEQGESIIDDLETMDALETLEEEKIAGVTEEAEQPQQEEPKDIAPTAATGVRGYVIVAAGLAVLMGLIGLATAWRRSPSQRVEW